MWYEFDAVNTVYHRVYDEGNKVYKGGVIVPVLWAIHSEDIHDADPDGARDVPTLRFAVPISTLRQRNISSVMDSRRHKNDVVKYRNTFFSIGDYRIEGRLGQRSMIVGVNAVMLSAADEFVYSLAPDGTNGSSTRRPAGRMNDEFVNQRFPEFEKPANQQYAFPFTEGWFQAETGEATLTVDPADYGVVDTDVGNFSALIFANDDQQLDDVDVILTMDIHGVITMTISEDDVAYLAALKSDNGFIGFEWVLNHTVTT